MSHITRSNVWKYFVKLDDKTAVCKMCQKKLKTSGRVITIFYFILFFYVSMTFSFII